MTSVKFVKMQSLESIILLIGGHPTDVCADVHQGTRTVIFLTAFPILLCLYCSGQQGHLGSLLKAILFIFTLVSLFF